MEWEMGMVSKIRVISRSATAVMTSEVLFRKRVYVVRKGFTTEYLAEDGTPRRGSGVFKECHQFPQTPTGKAMALELLEVAIQEEGGPYSLVETTSGRFLKQHGYGFIAEIVPVFVGNEFIGEYRPRAVNAGCDMPPHRLDELAKGLLYRMEG